MTVFAAAQVVRSFRSEPTRLSWQLATAQTSEKSHAQWDARMTAGTDARLPPGQRKALLVLLAPSAISISTDRWPVTNGFLVRSERRGAPATPSRHGGEARVGADNVQQDRGVPVRVGSSKRIFWGTRFHRATQQRDYGRGSSALLAN